ncbi:hypothetical protein J6590_027791 [Homalodisca vitripennis]|nr:hypothetical protein J6590_027791 [Homalodisca vitripennis]
MGLFTIRRHRCSRWVHDGMNANKACRTNKSYIFITALFIGVVTYNTGPNTIQATLCIR